MDPLPTLFSGHPFSPSSSVPKDELGNRRPPFRSELPPSRASRKPPARPDPSDHRDDSGIGNSSGLNLTGAIFLSTIPSATGDAVYDGLGRGGHPGYKNSPAVFARGADNAVVVMPDPDRRCRTRWRTPAWRKIASYAGAGPWRCFASRRFLAQHVSRAAASPPA